MTDLNKLLGIVPKPYSNPFPMVKKAEPEKLVAQPQMQESTEKRIPKTHNGAISGYHDKVTPVPFIKVAVPQVKEKTVAKAVKKVAKKTPSSVKPETAKITATPKKAVKANKPTVKTAVKAAPKKTGADTSAVMAKAMKTVMKDMKSSKTTKPVAKKSVSKKK